MTDLSSRIQSDIKKFLAQGGQIQQIPMGITNYDPINGCTINPKEKGFVSKELQDKARKRGTHKSTIAHSKIYFDFNGRNDSLINHCLRAGINPQTIYGRMRRGMKPEEAMELGNGRMRKKK